MHIKNQRKQKNTLKSKKICENAYLKGNVISLLKTIFSWTRTIKKWWKIIELKIFENWSRIKIIWKKTGALRIIWKLEFWKLFENGSFGN